MSNVISQDNINLLSSLEPYHKRMFSQYVNQKLQSSSKAGKAIQTILPHIYRNSFENWYNNQPGIKKQYLSKMLYRILSYLHEYLVEAHLKTPNNDDASLIFCQVLLRRGHLKKAKDELGRLRSKATYTEDWVLLSKVIDHERTLILMLLSSPHIADDLIALNEEKTSTLEKINEIHELQSLCDHLNTFIVHKGHMNEKDNIVIHDLAKQPILQDDKFLSKRALSLKHFFFSAYYYLTGNFDEAMNASELRLNLFAMNPGLIANNPRVYLSAANNYIVTSTQNRRFDKVDEWITNLQILDQATLKRFTQRDLLYYYEVLHFNQLEHYLLQFQMDKLSSQLPDIEKFVKEHEEQISDYTRIVLYYYLALAHYYLGNHFKAVSYISNIQFSTAENVREDYMTAAYLLRLIINLETDDPHLIHTVKSTMKYFLQKGIKNEAEQYILKTLTNKKTIDALQNKQSLIKMKSDFDQTLASTSEPVSFLRYFDVSLWLESRINKCSIPELAHYKA